MKDEKLTRIKELLTEFKFMPNHDIIIEEDDENIEDDMFGDDEISFDDSEDMGDSNTSMNQEEPAEEPMPPLDSEDTVGDFEVEDGTLDDAGEEEIELDVTELVNNTQEAKQKADDTNKKLDAVLTQLNSVIDSAQQIKSLSMEVDDLRDELIKRNPSKIEKLEMQSLHSAPYNVKIGDYWSGKQDYVEDISDGVNPFNEEEPIEYVVTEKDVDSKYNERNIANSFKKIR